MTMYAYLTSVRMYTHVDMLAPRGLSGVIKAQSRYSVPTTVFGLVLALVAGSRS